MDGGCIWRNRAGKDGTEKRNQIFDALGKTIILHGIDWFLTGKLTIESSSKYVSRFQTFLVIKEILPIEQAHVDRRKDGTKIIQLDISPAYANTMLTSLARDACKRTRQY